MSRSIVGASGSSTRATYVGHVVPIAAVVVLLSGCFLNFNAPDIELDARYWYNTNDILIPYWLHGDSNVAYGRYRIEYDAGSGWELQEEREIQIPSGSSGVIEYFAPNDMWFYRLTFSLLRSRDASAVPTPFMTEVQLFQIDRNPPGGPFDPTMPAYLTPSSPSSSPANNDLDIFANDPGIFSDGGSPVRLVYTTDGSIPTDWDRQVWGTGDPIQVWRANQIAPSETVIVRMMFIDDAGNRSGVFTASYTGS